MAAKRRILIKNHHFKKIFKNMAFIRQIKNMAKNMAKIQKYGKKYGKTSKIWQNFKNMAKLQKYGKCHINKVFWQPCATFSAAFIKKSENINYLTILQILGLICFKWREFALWPFGLKEIGANERRTKAIQ
jgi:hypothetical protein